MEPRLERIREKLEQAERAGRPVRLGPCVAEAQLSAFEARHGVRLPAGFRELQTELGEPRGPLLLGLDSWDEALEERIEGALARPCTIDPAKGYDDYPEDVDPAWGTIAIADAGATMYTVLVVSGPQRPGVFEYTRDSLESRQIADDYIDWVEKLVDHHLARG